MHRFAGQRRGTKTKFKHVLLWFVGYSIDVFLAGPSPTPICST